MKFLYQILVCIFLLFHCNLLHSQTILDESIKWDTSVVIHQMQVGQYPKIWIKEDSKSMVQESGGYNFRVQKYFEEICVEDEFRWMCEKVDTLDFASDSSIVTDWGKSTVIFERNKKHKLERKDILRKITSDIEDVVSSKEVYFDEDGLIDLVVFRERTEESFFNKGEFDTFFECKAYLNRGNSYELSFESVYEKLPLTICVSKFRIKGMKMIIALEDWSTQVENGYQLEIVKMKVGSD